METDKKVEPDRRLARPYVKGSTPSRLLRVNIVAAPSAAQLRSPSCGWWAPWPQSGVRGGRACL